MERRSCGACVALTLLLVACGASSSSDHPTSVRSTEPTTSAPTAPSATAPSTTVPSDAISEWLDGLRASYPAPGALALVRVDDQQWSGSSGAADLAGTTITPEATFRIASITKPIVATLVLGAVERGELTLDAIVGDLLPGTLRDDQPVTVRMLLDHTSGVFDESNDGDPIADIANLADPALRTEAEDLLQQYSAGDSVLIPDRLIVALSETHERYFPPGTGYHYSNTNYQLAAMVLEAVTGSSLDDLLRTRIIEPLGLQRTTIAPPDLTSPDIRGYGTSVDDDNLVDITDDLTFFGNGGNGGIVSDADELLTMMQAIVAGRVVGPDLVAAMSTMTKQSEYSYGLGLATYLLTCGTFYGHEGGVNGTASIALVSADGADGVVIALNLRDGSDPRLAARADDLLCPYVRSNG